MYGYCSTGVLLVVVEEEKSASSQCERGARRHSPSQKNFMDSGSSQLERKNRDVAGSASTFTRGEYYLVSGMRCEVIIDSEDTARNTQSS